MVLPFLTAGMAVVGLGLSIKGAMDQKKAAKAQFAAQQQITAQEQAAEGVRMRAMEFDARRRQLETVRQQQRYRAQALSATTASGASGGSGLMGAYGQFSGQTGNELAGIFGNLGLGREMGAVNQKLSEGRLQLAAAGGQMAAAQGLSSLGGAFISGASTFGSVATSALGGK